MFTRLMLVLSTLSATQVAGATARVYAVTWSQGGTLIDQVDRQLRDECVTLMLAGHETTAAALAWAFYLLSRSPHVLRALRAELARWKIEAPTPPAEPGSDATRATWSLRTAISMRRFGERVSSDPSATATSRASSAGLTVDSSSTPPQIAAISASPEGSSTGTAGAATRSASPA